MPITEAQRQARRHHLGSSDSPAILQVDPWSSPHDVYLSKVHELDDIKSNEAIDIGNEFEGPLLRWAAKELGVEIETNVSLVCPSDEIFAANLDGRVVGSAQGLEAKTGDGTEYGDEMTDQVPDRVIIQAHHQMFVADLGVVWVPALVAKFGRLNRCVYRVDRSEPLVGAVRDQGREFWLNHVVPKVPPTGWTPSLDTIKRIKRINGEVVPVAAELVARWEEAKAAEKEAKQARDEAQALMLAALGEAEAGDYGDPAKILTYLEQGRAGIDVKALRLAHPAIASQFATESRFRVARLKKR